jgi:hypothetical protein
MQRNNKGIFKPLEEIFDKEKENRVGLKVENMHTILGVPLYTE